MLRFVLVVALAATACGCVDSRVSKPDPDPGSLPIERLVTYTDFSGLKDPLRMVVRDADQFAEIWARAYAISASAPPLPQVDFTREMVVVVALGERPSGGFQILVESVTATDDGVVVDVESSRPGGDCAVHLALTQPFDMIKVAAVTGVVEFREQSAVRPCNR